MLFLYVSAFSLVGLNLVRNASVCTFILRVGRHEMNLWLSIITFSVWFPLAWSVFFRIPKTAIISFSYLSPISQYQRLAWPVCLGPDPPRPASHPRTAHATATWTALWTGPTLESWTTRPGHKRWRCPAKAWGSESAVASPLTSCYSCQILTCF